MKRHVPAFLTTLVMAATVTWAITAAFTKPGRLAQETIIPSARTPGIRKSVATIPAAASVKPVPPEQQVSRWEKMKENPDTLLEADAEIRALPLSAFPDICDAALKLKDPDRHPVIRLLCIRWAELDGLAALSWARHHFKEKDFGGRWGKWVNDICSAWFATQPVAASLWFASLEKGPEADRYSWFPLGQHIPLNEWSGTGSVVAVAEAQINRPGNIWTSKGVNDALAEQITTTTEIMALKKMVTEKNTAWPMRIVRTDGFVTHRSTGMAGLQIAAAYEKAWPRIDPEGWRTYAKEKVIGADGSHLVFQLVREDCRSASDPEAIAREFLQSSHLPQVNAQEWEELAGILESRRAGSGMDLLTSVRSVAAAQALVQIARERNPGDLPGTMEMLQRLSDPATRARAIGHALTTWSTDPIEAEAWLQNASLATDEKEAIRELLVSKPIQRDQ